MQDLMLAVSVVPADSAGAYSTPFSAVSFRASARRHRIRAVDIPATAPDENNDGGVIDDSLMDNSQRRRHHHLGDRLDVDPVASGARGQAGYSRRRLPGHRFLSEIRWLPW